MSPTLPRSTNSLNVATLLIAISIGVAYSQQNKSPNPGGPPTVIPQELLNRLEAHTDIVYARYRERELALDLYRPKNTGDNKLPAIVCIHGGGWWKGTRKNHGRIAQALADRGFVAATISYRLSGEAPFPAQIQDCKAAVRFLRAKADQYGINPDKIGAIGLSAGGHLTALLATSGGVSELEGEGGHAEFSSTIQAAVPMGAQSDFNAPHIQAVKHTPPPKPGEKPNLWTQFLGGTPNEVPEQYRLASPLTHLDQKDPPIHFITGELDGPATRAVSFRAKMKELGIPQDLTVIPKAPHAFPVRQKFFDQAIEVSTAWFDQHLKSPPGR